MKKICIFLSVLFVLVSIFIGYSLYYPPPSKTPFPSDIIYDENYFFTKFSQHNIQLLKENNFVITEDELMGYLNYQLKSNQFAINNNVFKLTYVDLFLLDNEVVLNIYGKISFLPVKVQTTLQPDYNDEKIFFSLKDITLSRLNLPKKYHTKLMEEALGMSSIIEEDGFILPLQINEMVIINSVQFQYKKINIQYRLNREKLLENFVNEFKKRIGN